MLEVISTITSSEEALYWKDNELLESNEERVRRLELSLVLIWSFQWCLWLELELRKCNPT